jgi:hypothetical protein
LIEFGWRRLTLRPNRILPQLCGIANPARRTRLPLVLPLGEHDASL